MMSFDDVRDDPEITLLTVFFFCNEKITQLINHPFQKRILLGKLREISVKTARYI